MAKFPKRVLILSILLSFSPNYAAKAADAGIPKRVASFDVSIGNTHREYVPYGFQNISKRLEAHIRDIPEKLPKKIKPSPTVIKVAKLKTAVKAKQKSPTKQVIQKVSTPIKAVTVKPSYFKPLNFKPELKMFDIQKPSVEASAISGHEIMPHLSGAILFGINVNNGSVAWKIPITKKNSGYGIDFVDEQYVFALLQNEFDESGVLKVIERASGVEQNSFRLWENLTYYQSYQQPFVVAKVDGNYLIYLVIRKPNRVSAIKKIVYEPKKNNFSTENYELNYLITSPLRYQPNLSTIYWGGKNKQTDSTILGQLDILKNEKRDYMLTAQDMDYADYIIEDPPLVLPSGYINLPHTLYFFVCLNQKVLSQKKLKGNLIAVYRLKEAEEPGQLAELKLPNHNLYKSNGRLISTPTLFKDPLLHNLNYVYFFAAIPPTRREHSGIENLLTMFEPYFWHKGVYLGNNTYSLAGLSNSNLLGVPLIIKHGSDYLMLMASDEVYVYGYVQSSSGQKTWVQDYRYNSSVQAGANSGKLFRGICSFPIRQINDLFLIKSIYQGQPYLYGFRLVKNEAAHYALELAWVFQGGDQIRAPMAYMENPDELLVVSREKLLRINSAALAKSRKPQAIFTRQVSITDHLSDYETSFSRPIIRKDKLYWVSSGTMFSQNINAEADQPAPPVKFADISKKITTGISFWGDKFCYGTQNNGVEVYTFDKDNFYPFFELNDAVSTTPMINENMLYFASEAEAENYVYGIKLDSQNLFMLPHPGWEVQDKTYTSSDSWRFRLNDAKVVSKPVSGRIGKKRVVFVGTTGGMIYAFEPKGGSVANKKGVIKQPVWKYKLPQIDEGISSPVVFDPTHNILYCMSNKGRLYVIDPTKDDDAVVFPVSETDDYRDFKSTDMTLAKGSLCFSATSKNQTSAFYCLNYNSGKYLRVLLPKEAVFEPLIVNDSAYISCRSGEIYRIGLPDAFIEKASQ